MKRETLKLEKLTNMNFFRLKVTPLSNKLILVKELKVLCYLLQ